MVPNGLPPKASIKALRRKCPRASILSSHFDRTRMKSSWKVAGGGRKKEERPWQIMLGSKFRHQSKSITVLTYFLPGVKSFSDWDLNSVSFISWSNMCLAKGHKGILDSTIKTIMKGDDMTNLSCKKKKRHFWGKLLLYLPTLNVGRYFF